MNTDSIRQIKCWIFEHACKYGMNSVLKRLVQDREALERMSTGQVLVENNATCSDSSLLFMRLLTDFTSSLKAATQNIRVLSMGLPCDLFLFMIELLNTSYQQVHYISSKNFILLITRLKLMALLKLLKEGQASSAVVQNLNIFFPRWNQDVKRALQKQLKVKDRKVLEKLENSHGESRKFILKLTVSNASRDTYLSNTYASDMQKFTTQSLRYLNEVLSAVKKRVGLSMIEMIVSGVYNNNPSYADDPAVQVTLEYVQSSVSENDLLNLLQAVDSGTNLQLNEGLWLGSLDAMSDFGSETGVCGTTEEIMDDDSDDDDESQSVDDDARVPNALEGTSAPFQLSLDENNILAGCTVGFVPEDDQMEIICDSEDEMASSDCWSMNSKYPAIHKHLLNKKITPCLIKLFFRKVMIINEIAYEIYS